MPTLLLLIFLVQLALNLISTLGAQTFNDLAWRLFTLLPTQYSSTTTDKTTTRQLRNEVLRLQREMNAVSAQDNFAKWARLRREHDKAKEKFEREAQSSLSFRTKFDSIISKLRWLGTQGVNFGLNTYFAKQPMFWLPQGWVPYPAEWILSFPRAPLGSISVNVWAIACGSVIAMVSEFLVAAWTLRQGKVLEGSNKGEKVKMEPMKVGGKKEL